MKDNENGLFKKEKALLSPTLVKVGERVSEDKTLRLIDKRAWVRSLLSTTLRKGYFVT